MQVRGPERLTETSLRELNVLGFVASGFSTIPIAESIVFDAFVPIQILRLRILWWQDTT